MVIRSLDNPNDTLSVIADDQGDVYVTIRHNGGSYKDSYTFTVRIGGPGSGHSIPPRLKQALHQLAHEFEVYKDCKNEADAFLLVDERETAPWLRSQIANAEFLLRECRTANEPFRGSLQKQIDDLKRQLAKIENKK